MALGEVLTGLDRLEDAVRGLRKRMDAAGDGTFVPKRRRFPPPSTPPDEAADWRLHFDRVAEVVWNLEEDEIGPLIAHLRRVSPPAALTGRLGVLLRLLLPERLAAAVEAVGDDLPDTVLTMAACDVVTPAQARDLAAVIQGWDASWMPAGADTLAKLAVAAPSPDLRQSVEARLGELPADRAAGTVPPAADPAPHGRAFRIADLGRLRDGDLIAVLTVVDKRTLGIALRSAPPETMRRVFSVMTDRSAAILRADMEALDDVGVDAVADARRDLRDAVLALAARGEIRLPDGVVPPSPDA